MMDKRALRKEKLKCRGMIAPEEHRVLSERITQRLAMQQEIIETSVVLCYVNYKSEVETLHFMADCLEQGKRVYCPKVLDDAHMEFYEIMSLSDLRSGTYGILEPVASDHNKFGCKSGQNEFAEKDDNSGALTAKEISRYDSGVCDSSVCDCNICDGHTCMVLPGAAFDRYGNRIGYGKGYYDRYLADHPEMMTIGICFSCQLADGIPAEDTDIRVDKIITENEVYKIV